MENNNWDNSYQLGIEIIDNQHKKFFEILNTINKTEKKTYESAMVFIKELEDYIIEHFKYEEELMKLSDYADIEQHKIQHRHFIEKIEEFKLKHEYQNTELFNQIILFVRKWFINHILQTDFQYRNTVQVYIKKHN